MAKKSVFLPKTDTLMDGIINRTSHVVRLVYLSMPAILSMAFIIAVFGCIFRKSWSIELLGNTLLISGAVLIASGVVISSKTKKFLLTIRNQERDSPTYYLRYTNMLRFAIHAIDLHNNGWSLLKIKSLYLKQLSKITTPGGVRSYLTQARAADMIIQSSNRAEAGTFLIVLGTILLMIHSFNI